ncbi:MAG: peptide deformylase [archaeon]
MAKLKGKSKAKKRKNKQKLKAKRKNSWKKKMLSEIRKRDDPILKKNCEPVSEGTEDLEYFIKKLVQVLGVSTGVGLAAPQIGYTYRIFATRPMGKGSPINVMINPRILELGNETDWMKEGCLSFPGVFKDIERYKTIKLEYYDKHFKRYEKEFEGLEARIIQHEMDHLKGRCIVGE